MRGLNVWIALGIVLGTMAYAIAEDVTLTTYYPSPRGAYEQIITTGQTTLATNGGNVGVGTTTPTGKLDVRGDIRAGNSDLYFTKTDHNHTGIGNAAGFAAIENAVNYDALMILGRSGTVRGRYVKLWDFLQVNGGLEVTSSVILPANVSLPTNGSIITFPEVSGNTGYTGLSTSNGMMADGVPWYGGVGREPGAWTYPYPDLVLSHHTGIRLAAHSNYGGIAFYEQLNPAWSAWSSSGTEIARFRDTRWAPYAFHLSGGGTIGITRGGVTGELKIERGSDNNYYAVYAP